MERDQLYRDYITIVFGLVATKGLEKIAERAIDGHLHWDQGLFFIGAFLIGIHYWYVCVSYAGISSPTYKTLANKPSLKFSKNIFRIVFFGVPVLFVTIYAGAVVVFFYSIPGNYKLLFSVFLVLLVASAINDVWDFATTLLAGKQIWKKENYRALKLTGWWFLVDGGYSVVFWFIVKDPLVSLAATSPMSAGVWFLVLIAVGVVLDALVTPLQTEAPAPAGKEFIVDVISDPIGADVSLDGQSTGKTPAALKLTTGKHTITLRMTGHKDWATDFNVAGDSKLQLSVTLQK